MYRATMKNQPINEQESEILAGLLKRAIANGQLNLHIASPYADGKQWKHDGWSWNDRHDGMACSSNRWHVEHGMAEGDHVNYDETPGAPEFIEGEMASVSIYVQEDDLATLAGVRK